MIAPTEVEQRILALLESNEAFMSIVKRFPENMYSKRKDEEYKEYPTYSKYVDYRYMTPYHARLVAPLLSPPQRTVLDIGGGAGYAAFMLKTYGHRVCTIDINEDDGVELLAQICNALGIPTVIHRVEAFSPLPAFSVKFDLIFITNPVFDVEWGMDEYRYFLHNLYTLMSPNGQIYLRLNTGQGELIFSDPKFLALFLVHGAETSSRRLLHFKNIQRLKYIGTN